MDDSTLNQIAMVFYMAASLVFLYRFSDNKHKPGKVPMGLTWSGFCVQTVAFIWRWIASYRHGFGHAPLSNRYESVIFFSWSVVAMFLIFDRFLPLRRFGGFIVVLGAVGIASTSIIPGADSTITPLIPALQSNWLFFHVVTCFLGYSAFAIAFFAGIMSLARQGVGANVESSEIIRNLDLIMYRTVMSGFILLTLGIISGSAWAYNAWGRYWGWDPKEVWSLITWFVYAVFLHARVTRGWSGKRLAWISVVGFIFVLFTFLGVNYLPIFKGLHTYA
ncbi:c-type cytochrome biogenesis protein CcsB [bacterium]|nr:c-type cytochrome biogenesis protein CcsB [candidate division CSSED10-310 bacterium]